MARQLINSSPSRLFRNIILFVGLLLGALSAQAAVNCSSTTPNSLIYVQDSTAIPTGPTTNPVAAPCTGLTVGAAYYGCTTSDITTATGTGGSTVSPKTAKSASGATIQFVLLGAGGSAAAAANQVVFYTTSAAYANQSIPQGNPAAGGQVFYLQIPSQTVVAGDYYTNITYTINMWTASNCTGTVVSTFQLTLPIFLKVGANCQFSTANSNSDFGLATVSSGTTINAATSGYGAQYSCNTGMAYYVTVSQGNNPTGTGPNYRRMYNSANGGSYIAYAIYANPMRTTLMTEGPVAKTGANHNESGGYGGTNSWYLSVPSQDVSNLSAGTYTDTLVLTLTW